ncbi:caspase family protein [Fibrella sp. WM1]|uniref:caspase family protein n=1 Tax=Fibrella musci TaxID=3242485 RepID=UPI00352127E7
MFRFVLLFLLGLSGTLYAQKNRALVVAIGNYPRETGWGVIDAQNDVPLIQQVLTRQQFADVTLLTDRQADRAGIMQAFRALIDRCQKGDNVLIHFSSHGQQISDQNNDEADGYDEAIVCYGAPNRAEGAFADYDGSKHLRDDELGALIDELRQKLGADGDVLLLADACHSGTITRGGGITKHRGGAPLKTRQHRAPAQAAKPTPYSVFIYKKTPSQTGIAPYVAMSAANANELNYQCFGSDGKEVGSLSYAFNQAMQQARVGESYRDLFARIQSIMKQKVSAQTPQIEGDLDRQLFGGAVVAQEPYLTVKTIGGNNRQLTLTAGQLEGVFDSTRVAVCSNVARDAKSSPVLATGVVVRTTPYAATVLLDKALPAGKTPADYRVFVTERSTGDLTVGIILDSLTDRALRQRVQAELAQNRMARFTGQPDLYLKANPQQANALTFYRATDGSRFDATPVPANQLAQLSTQVQRYLQSQFLQRTNFAGNPSVQFSATLVPLRRGFRSVADTTSAEVYRQGALLGFTAFADTVVLKVTNLGTVPLYYTVIDIMPNGDVAVMLPNAYPDRPENYMVPPGKTVLSYRFIRFEPPYGKETFKVFATTEPVDLRPIVGQSRGPSSRFSNPLSRFFNSTNSMAQQGMGTRGGGTGTLPDDANIATVNYEFLILKK